MSSIEGAHEGAHEGGASPKTLVEVAWSQALRLEQDVAKALGLPKRQVAT
ncbi:hypothetical protein V3331_01885 [Gaopeijia maritima]